MTPERVTITIDELVLDGRPLGSGEDVEAAVRAALEQAPAQRAPVDTERVAAAIASAVDAEAGT